MSAQTEFIARIAPVIVRYAKAYGYKVASPIIAQACLESAWGASKLAALYYNFFGMKVGSSWKGKYIQMKTREEYVKGQLTTITDKFRVYSSLEDGVNGYFDFISTKRYADLKTATTPRQYLEFIKEDGYATSTTYVENNMSVVEKYCLQNWDKLMDALQDDNPPAILPDPASGVSESDRNPAPYAEPTKTQKYGSKGNGTRWLQYMLNRHGYRLTVDGIFGIRTECAVVHFQWKNGLVIDGLAGVKTRARLKAV